MRESVAFVVRHGGEGLRTVLGGSSAYRSLRPAQPLVVERRAVAGVTAPVCHKQGGVELHLRPGHGIYVGLGFKTPLTLYHVAAPFPGRENLADVVVFRLLGRQGVS